MQRRKKKYQSDMPRRMYTYFATYDGTGAPSFSKFARSVGITHGELIGFLKHKSFKDCYNECSEIRRDYLIDNALTKKFDGSFVKFLLDIEKCREADEANTLSLELEILE